MNKEKVKELISLVYSEHLNPSKVEVIAEWFEKNTIDLAHYFSQNIHTHPINTVQCIENWLKTQTFAQLHQLEPNWDEIPTHINEVSLEWTYYGEKKIEWSRNVILEDFKRPNPPTPKVEVGQVWKCAKTEVTVIALNDDDVVFQNKLTKGFDVYSITDFIAKFEQVEGE
jgi:hypothetical protein